VMLADRIIALSPRPAEIVADIAVDLPRPRRHDDTRRPAFGAIADQVFAALADGMAKSDGTLAAQ
ncbi:MAG: ABC transporter ATP-binding protein, partial [Hyphomicrobiales bacterium]